MPGHVNCNFVQIRNQLRTPGVAKNSVRGVKIFELSPIVFNYAQRLFPGEQKILQGASLPCVPP